MEKALPLFVAIPLGAAFLLPLLEKSQAGSRISRLMAVIVSIFLLGLAASFLG